MNFRRKNKPALFDKYRGILIPDTPEERVRQTIADSLEYDYLIPADRITTEFPLSRWDAKSRRRADIIVWAPDATENIPLLVVEAKAPHIPLTDDVHEQAIDYLETLGCQYYGVTNGNEHRWYFKTDDDFRPLVQLPKYPELISHASLKFTDPAPPLQRLPLTTTHSHSHVYELLQDGIIGQDTQPKLHAFFSELDNFLLTEPMAEPLPLQHKSFTILRDLGLSYRSYGNAAGGSWAGIYRGFMLQDSSGDHQIYRLAIMGKGKFVNHPTFGNSRAHTILVVAVDDFDKSHNSLQMNLDRSVLAAAGGYRIVHDGKITIGNKGGQSPAALLEFIGISAADGSGSVPGIELGFLPNDRSLSWSKDKNFVLNLLHYAYMRDEFRKSVQAKHKEKGN